MRIAVFGATGPSGQQVVKHGLQAGHHIVALVRNPQKLEGLKTENLQVCLFGEFVNRGIVTVIEYRDLRMSWQ